MILVIIELVMAVLFFMMGVMFSKSNGKGCKYLAGYNIASEEERKQYNEKRICKYMGRQFQLIAMFFVLGAIVDWFWPEKGYIIAFVLFIMWLIHHIYIRYKKFDNMFKIK